MGQITTRRPVRVLWAITAALALVVTNLVSFPTVATADDNNATAELDSSCLVTPEVTPPAVLQTGVQAVVPGEVMTFAHEVSFDEGTVYQDVFTRPDGSVYFASYIETISPASNLIVDAASPALIIGGTVTPMIAGAAPDPDDFVLTQEASGGVTTWRVLFPGDADEMNNANNGYGSPSYDVAAGGGTFVFTFRAQVPTPATPGTVERGA